MARLPKKAQMNADSAQMLEAGTMNFDGCPSDIWCLRGGLNVDFVRPKEFVIPQKKNFIFRLAISLFCLIGYSMLQFYLLAHTNFLQSVLDLNFRAQKAQEFGEGSVSQNRPVGGQSRAVGLSFWGPVRLSFWAAKLSWGVAKSGLERVPCHRVGR